MTKVVQQMDTLISISLLECRLPELDPKVEIDPGATGRMPSQLEGLKSAIVTLDERGYNTKASSLSKVVNVIVMYMTHDESILGHLERKTKCYRQDMERAILSLETIVDQVTNQLDGNQLGGWPLQKNACFA